MSLVVMTPSHAPDFDGFARLHASVQDYCARAVTHLVVVPDADVSLFESLRSPTLTVIGYRTILPRRFVSTTSIARIPKLPRGYRIGAVNIAKPWPPVRGWILQQLIKLATVSELTEDTVLLIDSDVMLIKPVEESQFRRSGVVRLYRQAGGITPGMTRHLQGQATARELLDSPAEPDTPDYVSAFASWDPNLVRECVATVGRRHGHPWQETIGRCLQFSEFLLYGTFVMTRAAPEWRSFTSPESLCHSHWTPAPLTTEEVPGFVESIRPHDLAVHVQSNSGTDAEVVDLIAHEVGRRTD